MCIINVSRANANVRTMNNKNELIYKTKYVPTHTHTHVYNIHMYKLCYRIDKVRFNYPYSENVKRQKNNVGKKK